MTENDIKNTYSHLSAELRSALSTMEYSDKVKAIRGEIKSLQEICPHSADFNHTGKCSYCGKK